MDFGCIKRFFTFFNITSEANDKCVRSVRSTMKLDETSSRFIEVSGLGFPLRKNDGGSGGDGKGW